MDSSINEFLLMVPTSLDSILSIPAGTHIVNDFQYGEGIYVSNASNTEFVFLKFNNGRIGQELDAVILTDSLPSEAYSSMIHSEVLKYKSTFGANLGMSKSDFESIYINGSELKGNAGSIFVQRDSNNLLYNKFYFRNDTLRKIEIGYDW